MVGGGIHKFANKTQPHIDVRTKANFIRSTLGDDGCFADRCFARTASGAQQGEDGSHDPYYLLLSHCSAHGLRKAAARRLAEAGCTEHETASITGHASLREIARYTKAVDQKRLTVRAMDQVKSRTSNVANLQKS